MKIVSHKERLAKIAEHWYGQYEHTINGNDSYKIHGKTKGDIYKELLALNGEGTQEQIDAIIGNGGWTRIRCDECDNPLSEDVLQLGEEPGCDSSTIHVCKDCLKKAYEMLA